MGKLLAAFIFIVSLSLPPSITAAEVQWIDLSVAGGDSVRAAFGAVEGERGPAVIFNHGTGVRQFGHKGSVSNGNMDVTDYVKALNALGYTAIAPVRSHLKDSAYYERGGTVGSTADWIAVVENGMQVAKAARSFLAANANVDPARIAIMGFSEGGNVTLWSAVRQQGYRAVVLLAPA
ncbi:MAG: prolyl oligopeptidase family serine peptidase, partial [Rhodospirillales bacterium]|nr:prolyl oligopeptidase family serine peptidase [Rhodospirillales bacterium]